MRPITTSYGDGLYRATEDHVLSIRRGTKLDGTVRGLIYAHGASHTSAMDATATHRFILDAFADAGYVALITEMGGLLTFGNDASRDAFLDSVTYVRARGASTDPLVLAAGSMGAMPALYWASTHLSDVAAIALIIPAVDVKDIYDNDRGGLASDIDTAWGGAAAWAAAEPTRNPINYAASLSSIPIGIWYSSDDTIVLPARVEAFAAVHGNTDLHSMGAVGHAQNAATTLAAAAWLAEQAGA